MRKRFSGIISGLLAAVFILSLFPVFAETSKEPPEVSARAAVVYNLEAGEILFSKNMDARLDPAAFTKLLTALLGFEHMGQNGNVNVTITKEMLAASSGNSMNLKEGEVLPFKSLLTGLVVQNANDAAIAIAVTVSGSVSSFVDRMNERAKLLGMENSYFSNPTGTDSAAMYTTMQDVLTLSKALYRVNDFMVMSENPKVTIPETNKNKQRVYNNKNPLVSFSWVNTYYLENSRGMIAGFTPRAGYCVATVHEIPGSKTLVIVSGGSDRSTKKDGSDITAYREAKSLMQWAEKNYSMRYVLEKGMVVCEKRLRLASGVDHMILVTGESLKMLLPMDVDLSKEITTEVRTDREVYTAPIIEGTAYGEIDVYYNGDLVDTVPLVAKSNIGLSRGLVAWDAVVSFFSHGAAKVVLILVILGLVLYVAILILAAVIQYLRQNKEQNRIIREMKAVEDRRLRKIRLQERKASQARMRKMRNVLRAGYQVLQGDSEAMDQPGRGQRRPPASKAVAKVPEKYRSTNRNPQTPANNRPPERNVPPRRPTTEVYRTGRPIRPNSQNRSRTAPSQDPRYGRNGKGTGKK